VIAAASEVSLGVVGCGNFARSILLPRFKKQKDVKLQAVVTARGMSAKAVAEQFGFAYCSESTEQVLEDQAVNTIVVATRHNLHGPLVAKALAAGKHVFVENRYA